MLTLFCDTVIPSIRTYCKKNKKKTFKEDSWTRKCDSPIIKPDFIKMEDEIYQSGTYDIDPLRLSPELDSFRQEYIIKEEPLDL